MMHELKLFFEDNTVARMKVSAIPRVGDILKIWSFHGEAIKVKVTKVIFLLHQQNEYGTLEEAGDIEINCKKISEE